MKLYMKQKVFSFGDKFTIKDENQVDRYSAEGEVFSMGKKLHLYSGEGNEVAFIKQKIWNFLPKFEVYTNGVLVMEVVKEFAFFSHKYTLRGGNWTVEGDMFGHDYTIFSAGLPIVRITKVWFSWGDSYEIDIADGVPEVLALTVVLAIDCAMAVQS